LRQKENGVTTRISALEICALTLAAHADEVVAARKLADQQRGRDFQQVLQGSSAMHVG